MTVLIAEDDRDIREVLAELLRDEGYTVFTAGDGVAALASIERDHPDVVVLDLWMPRKTGGEVLAELHDHEEQPAILVLSASLHRAAGIAADAKLAKPFDVNELLATLEEIGRRRGPALRAITGGSD